MHVSTKKQKRQGTRWAHLSGSLQEKMFLVTRHIFLTVDTRLVLKQWQQKVFYQVWVGVEEGGESGEYNILQTHKSRSVR